MRAGPDPRPAGRPGVLCPRGPPAPRRGGIVIDEESIAGEAVTHPRARTLLAGQGIRREGIAELPHQTTSPQARARRGRGHLEGFALCGWAEAGGDTPVELQPPVQEAARGLLAAAGDCESRPREPLPPTPTEANARACTHRRRRGL